MAVSSAPVLLDPGLQPEREKKREREKEIENAQKNDKQAMRAVSMAVSTALRSPYYYFTSPAHLHLDVDEGNPTDEWAEVARMPHCL